MAAVVLQHLTKVFPGPKGEVICALNDCTLTVAHQELLVLVGPSGCGKTTTLRLVAGLEQPTQGTISIDGQVVNAVPPGQRDVAMVFQSPALYPHLSVYENLAFGLKLRKCGAGEIRRRVLEAAEILELADCLERMPQQLSGGQRQRVALGRAMVRKPSLLLLDEPLSNLDPAVRLQMRGEIVKLHGQFGTTMIYVTHDQAEAMVLGRRIAVLKQGVIQQIDDPLTIYDRPGNLFTAGFIGSPPMNFLRGTLLPNGENWLFQELAPTRASVALKPFSLLLSGKGLPALGSLAGKEIIIGIRAEDLTINHGDPSAATQHAVATIVETAQTLGWETLVYLRTTTHSLAVRAPARIRVQRDEIVTLVLNVAAAHFFDPATESAIR